MRTEIKYFFFILSLLMATVFQNELKAQWPMDMVMDQNMIHWVDSVYDSMSDEEKIGQLLMIRAHSNLGEPHIREVKRLIEKYHVGALCFFQGNPLEQARLTNKYQELSRVPMLVAIDAEWGLGMRFREDGISFPRQLTLGALQNNQPIFQMGEEIARQLRRIGVHINFAPVIDVNNNPANPVINDRSFGELKELVAVKGNAYMRGLQEGGIMACGKHFPGHGDTDVDSHFDLPVIRHDRDRMSDLELFPFRQLIPQGMQSIMIAHLHIPAYDDTPNLPTTLSYEVVTRLLKEEMNFRGLIITDAMEMKGVTKFFPSGEAELKAFLAGNDVICLPADVPKAAEALLAAYREGVITEERLAESVKKILSAKYHLGLANYQPVDLNGLEESVNDPAAFALKSTLIKRAITLVRDEQEMFPFNLEEPIRRHTLAIGTSGKNAFQSRLDDYGAFRHHSESQQSLNARSRHLMDQLSSADQVIISLHRMGRFLSNNYGLEKSTIDFINELSEKTEVVLVVFGSPYSLQFFDEVKTVLVAYEDGGRFRDIAAQAIGGANAINGRLPVTASDRAKAGMGLNIPSQMRLGFTEPENVGMCSKVLSEIDELMAQMIAERAAPGGQVLVAKEGKVIYHKSFGYHTYDQEVAVQNHHLYDLASLTKVLAATYSMMHLYDREVVNIFNPIGEYLPYVRNSNKENLRIHDIMVHKSGLPAWIPFYRETITRNGRQIVYNPEIYSHGPNPDFAIRVSNQLWMANNYPDIIRQEILEAPLGRRNRYVYSDLGFIMFNDLIKEVSGEYIDGYTEKNIFEPLGLRNTLYNPYRFFPDSLLVPSEEDRYFRSEVVRGHVHDMAAAMFGGVSGHAGLFSNSLEVAKIMQSLLNGGVYAGNRIVDPLTVSLFTTRPQMESRRGIGFDMKELNNARHPNMSEYASFETFGHMGFTGTVAWVDPEHDLVFVMLTNRTFPTMENRRFIRNQYRIKVHDVIYQAIQRQVREGV